MLIAISTAEAAAIGRDTPLSDALQPSWMSLPDAPLRDVDRVTQQAIDTFLDYQCQNGSVRGIGWWQLANGYTAIALSELWSGGTRNYQILANAIRQCERRVPHLRNVFRDDTCWWAILCVHMYSLEGDPWFLKRAISIWNRIRPSVCRRGQVRFKDCDMEGGVYWKEKGPKSDHVNAISTGLYAELSARLALVHLRKSTSAHAQQDSRRSPPNGHHDFYKEPVDPYIQMARRCLAWILRCRYRPRKGVVLDHLELDQQRAVDWTFTYNTGVALGVCALLYDITRECDYMTLACRMAHRSMTRSGWVEPNGVLTEKRAYGRGTHDPFKPNDAVGFKSVLMRQLGMLYDVIVRTRCSDTQAQAIKDMIHKFVRINYQSQQERNSDGRGQFGPWWTGPFEFPTSHSQMAALDVFTAAQLLNCIGQADPRACSSTGAGS